jgi:hypothetical protein
MHPHEHRDRSALLSGEWLRGDRRARRSFWNKFWVSDVQAPRPASFLKPACFIANMTRSAKPGLAHRNGPHPCRRRCEEAGERGRQLRRADLCPGSASPRQPTNDFGGNPEIARPSSACLKRAGLGLSAFARDARYLWSQIVDYTISTGGIRINSRTELVDNLGYTLSLS